MLSTITNSAFYFERFYMSFIFSITSFSLYFIFKNIIKKPIRKDRYQNPNEYLSWYLKYKFYLILKFFLIISVGTLIISVASLIQYFYYSS
jgi:hypothetical protein